MSGTYSVTVTVGGCTSAAGTVSVTVNAVPATPTITQSGLTLTSSSATGNQWYLDGNPISGATSQNYTATTNGNYTVVVTTAGCSSATSAVTAVTSVGIDVNSNPDYLVIYPNPSEGEFVLSLFASEKTDYTIIIRNAIGQIVYQMSLKDQTGSFNDKITLLEFGRGMYLVSLVSAKNETVKKIVVY
jgi:hypothetical protein